VSDPSEARIKDDLSSIDPDHSYDLWHRAGIALFNYYEGTDRGLRVRDEWSRRGSKNEEGVCAEKWEGLQKKSSLGKYTQTWWHFMAFARAQEAVSGSMVPWIRGKNGYPCDVRPAARQCHLALRAKVVGFPAFPVRSSRVQYNGRKRRSCNPV